MRAVILLLALALCAACVTTRAEHSLQQKLIDGAIDAETYDFGALKFGPNADAPALDRLWSALPEAVGGSQAMLHDCSPHVLRVWDALTWIELAQKARDRSEYDASVAALRARVGELAAASNALGRDEIPAHLRPGLDAALDWRDAAQSAKGLRTRALFTRAARDEAVRGALYAPAWTDGLPPPAANEWQGAILALMAVVDCDNLRWLRAELDEVGWFDIRRYGARADSAAWLLTQHADHDPAFQRQMIARLERLAPDGETDPRNLAYLSDRIAVADGRPQRYATQLRCEHGQQIATNGVEDAANLDARRAALGLPSFADYVALVQRNSPCPADAASP